MVTKNISSLALLDLLLSLKSVPQPRIQRIIVIDLWRAVSKKMDYKFTKSSGEVTIGSCFTRISGIGLAYVGSKSMLLHC